MECETCQSEVHQPWCPAEAQRRAERRKNIWYIVGIILILVLCVFMAATTGVVSP